MTKQEQREQLLKDIKKYTQSGGKVKLLTSKKIPVNRKVT